MHLEELLDSQVAPGGASVLMFRGGREFLRVTRGEALPGAPMERDAILLWLSSGKPVLAVAVAMLVERRRLNLDTRVSDYLPQFTSHAKELITVRHLLTHTAGLHRALKGIWEIPSWGEAISRVCDAELPEGFVPGEHAAYDPGASWFILAEIVTRAAGEPFERFIEREILAAAGMSDAAYCYTPEAYQKVAPRLARYFTNTRGHVHPLHWNEPPLTEMPRPGGSLRATIDDMARFYGALLDGLLVRADTLEQITSSQRGKMLDRTFGREMEWGLGIMPNNGIDAPYNFGPAASSKAFGHGGQQSSIVFADPETRTVFAAAYTTLPGEPAHNRRMNELLQAVFTIS